MTQRKIREESRMKPKIVKQIQGGYFQDSDGVWWDVNPQHGWQRVDTEGKAFRFYFALTLNKR
jgi:hypothetical protein